MSKDFEIIQWTLDEAKLQAFTPQLRNQLFACMHAHNELTTFNRLLMFSTTAFGKGELHDLALSVQMWSMLQVGRSTPMLAEMLAWRPPSGGSRSGSQWTPRSGRWIRTSSTAAQKLASCPFEAVVHRNRKFADSPLEQAGFEL